MKLSIVLAALVATTTAFAETKSASATTTAPAATQEASKEGTKEAPTKKKAKKAKKGDKASTTQAPADQKAAQTSEATAPAAAATTAPAAGTNTAAQPAAPAKKWGLSYVNEASVTNEGMKRLAKAQVETNNVITASYKITATEKIAVKQYFGYNYDPEVDFKREDILQGFTVLTASTKRAGILGSDDIYPMLWYYLPNDTAEKNYLRGETDKFAGILRLDAEVGWTINPLFSVSYYFNPRQSLGGKDEVTGFEPTSRLVHYANFYYNINDNAQAYFNAGFDHRMTTANQRSTSDTYLSAIGAQFTFLGGKLTLNPEIGTSVPLKVNGEYVNAPRWYQTDDIGYTLSTVIAL